MYISTTANRLKDIIHRLTNVMAIAMSTSLGYEYVEVSNLIRS